jgi:hypothetical protein
LDLLDDFRVITLYGTVDEWEQAQHNMPSEVQYLIRQAIRREKKKNKRDGYDADGIVITLPERHIPGSLISHTGRRTAYLLQAMVDNGIRFKYARPQTFEGVTIRDDTIIPKEKRL